jgi:very-short-patch-repair endonuclease
LPNKNNNCLTGLSAATKEEIIKYYLKPSSQKATALEFKITLHGLQKLLKFRGVLRNKYSEERNKLVSTGIKKTLKQNPELVANKIKLHTGTKRSLESRKRMQEAAWKRMEKQKDTFVSKAEKQFGDFLENKLGLTVQRQYRKGLKPFDFLIDGKVLVEFDGPHHYDPTYYLCVFGKVDFEKQQERDAKRFEIAEKLGLPLVVVRQKDVDSKMQLKGDAMHKFMGDLGYEVI